MSGKSFLIKKIIERSLYDDEHNALSIVPERVIWIYGGNTCQPMHEELSRLVDRVPISIIQFDGSLIVDDILDSSRKTILILDDMQQEICENKELSNALASPIISTVEEGHISGTSFRVV